MNQNFLTSAALLHFPVLHYNSSAMRRDQLFADPADLRLHDLILASCRSRGEKTAIVDSSCGRRISYAAYGEIVQSIARGLRAAGLQAGEVVAIFLANSWEFAAAYHAITLAQGIPTPLNPSYREREVRYQLQNAGAAMLVTDGCHIEGIELAGLPRLRRVYTTRRHTTSSEPFTALLSRVTTALPLAEASSNLTVAALPYSSGTTGLPKGVMLSHYNLVANVYQILGPHAARFKPEDRILCFLPLYHIYGLNVILNPGLILGATIVLMPRFAVATLNELLQKEAITMMPLVPPAMNAICQAAEGGQFETKHQVLWVKSGAAPLAPELARRFTALTGIPIAQGYGMTEASPVTHLGFLEPELYRPDSIGHPVAETECRLLRVTDADGAASSEEAATDEPGELVMRGPQFMLGYWNEPQATNEVLRDGWYWSGDIVTRDRDGFYRVVDRRKEMIKYKGFPVAPAEVEAVLMEHPAVRECGVIGRPDPSAGEIPVAFVALREGFTSGKKLEDELSSFVADRLTSYKQPRQIHFIAAIPKTASGKVLRRELRNNLS